MEATTKKKILLGVAIAAGCLFLAALIWFIFYVGQFSTYEDKPYAFSVKYPNDWKKVEAPQPGVAAVFVSPKENALDPFQENINITLQDVPAQIATLKDFSDTVVMQMTKGFGNIKVLESKSFSFGGRQGYRVLFAADKPQAVNILTVWTIRRGVAYIFTFMAMKNRYETYMPLVEEMLKSFELK